MWHCSKLRTQGDSPGIDIGASDGTNIATVHYDPASQTPDEVRAIAQRIVALVDPGVKSLNRRDFNRTTVAGALALMLVDPWEQIDSIIWDGEYPAHGGIATCDICEESFCEDVWASLPIRKFFYNHVEQLTYCEHCRAKEPSHA